MAKIAIIAAAAVAGAVISVATGGLGTFAVGAWAQDIIAGASVGASIGGLVAQLSFPPKSSLQMPLQDLQVSSSADGAPIPFGYGACRFGGQVIWCPKITFKSEHVNPPGGGGSGGGGSNQYFYFANFAVAFGEGPATLRKIWGDSKLIYKAPGNEPGNGLPLGDTPPWDAGATYDVDDMVTFPGPITDSNSTGLYVYQAILPVPAGISPAGNSLYWELDSEYPPWQSSGVTYLPGMTVDYQGQIWAVTQTPVEDAPKLGGHWAPLQQYYGVPAIYPGDEEQLPDPTIQGAEGANSTSAYRGLCYAVWENFPLANFGNRVPNLRAEVFFGDGTDNAGAATGSAVVLQHAIVQNLEPLATVPLSIGPTTAGSLIIAAVRWQGGAGAGAPPVSIAEDGFTPVFVDDYRGIWYKIADGSSVDATLQNNAGGFAFHADAFLLEVESPGADAVLTTAAASESGSAATVAAGGVAVTEELGGYPYGVAPWAAAMFTFDVAGTKSSIAVIMSNAGFKSDGMGGVVIPTGWTNALPAETPSWTLFLGTSV